MSEQLLAFYGDDITGSTDAMDALGRAGVETVLFLDPPDQSTVDAEFEDAQAIGVAGTSRSMTPAEMDEALPPVFESLSALSMPIVHYKICSTFDSAPDIGSIGHAIDIATEAFEGDTVPVVPAAPALGRYVTFGNMFAADEDGVYRLDRHPTMSEHPVTPMDESDLRRHLGEQTNRSMALVDVLGLDDAPDKALAEARDDAEIVFFDTLDADHQQTVGRLVWEQYAEATDETAFAVGSSGFEYAMTDHWATAGIADETAAFDPLDPVDRLLVVSGSASPVTKTQIEAALDAGFAGVRIDTAALVDPATADEERERVRDAVLSALREGDSVVAYTALGPDDDAVAATKARARELDDAPDDVGRYIGHQQGKLLRDVLDEEPLDRVCVAGGDTCGHVTPHLDVYALQMRFPLAAGSPMCTARATTDRFDGLEIALKGGQLGGPDFFVRSRDGASEW